MTHETYGTFEAFNFHPKILQAINELNYKTPTAVQSRAIPAAMSGRDLIASAQTGTGKTAAFVLPILQRLAEKPGNGKARGLVLTPTRELAQQVTAAASQYGKYLRFSAISIVGGMSYRLQSRPADLIIATPGRLMDLMSRRHNGIDLSGIEFFVLDEADRMLDMGFIEDMEHIAQHLKQVCHVEKRQTLLFSATIDSNISRLARNLLENPEIIEVTPQKVSHSQIEQRLYIANDMGHKDLLLTSLLESETINQAIIFSATKRHAENFAKQLRSQGRAAAALHGDMKQRERNHTLDKLRRGDIELLVATDVAARGIDVPGITHVINYDLPRSAEDYVHRIGRTGRAGQAGTAITFATYSEHSYIRRIESYTGAQLPQCTIVGLEPAADSYRGGGGKKPKRYSGARGGYGGGGYGNRSRSSSNSSGYASRTRPSGENNGGGGYSSRARSGDSNGGGGYPSRARSTDSNGGGGYPSRARSTDSNGGGGYPSRARSSDSNGGGGYPSRARSSDSNGGGGYPSRARSSDSNGGGGYPSRARSSDSNGGGGYPSRARSSDSNGGGYVNREARFGSNTDGNARRSPRPANANYADRPARASADNGAPRAERPAYAKKQSGTAPRVFVKQKRDNRDN